MSLSARLERRLGALDLALDLVVAPGEVLALLGPNGAGKSTVLRCLAGLTPLHGGCIAVDDEVLDSPAEGIFVEPEHRSTGMVFQDYVLFEHMTALDNVAFGLRTRGVAKVDARAVASTWLARVGIESQAGMRPVALSGGQAQRVAVARALAPRPRVLLLDEPLAALDVGTRTLVRRDLGHHLGEFDGMTVLVTHDPVDAYALADRVAIIEAGRIVQTGTLAEVTAHPRSRYVADLVGMNLVSGTVHDHLLTTDAGVQVVIADPGSGPSFAVIRPHSISLLSSAPTGASARNVWRGTISDIDRLGDRVRVGILGELPLTAEITAAALEAMGLRAGQDIHVAVKATEIDVYPS